MFQNDRLPRLAEWLCLLLLIVAFGLIQVMIGGTRMAFSLPTCGVLGLAGVLALFSLRAQKPPASHVCLAVTAVFFAYILARAWLSPVPYVTRSDVYSVLGGLVVYYLVACVLTGSKQRMLFMLFLLAVGIAHSVIGALQFRDGNNYMPIWWLQRYDYGSRASGFYVCPNHLAGYLEVVGVIGLGMVCWSRWPVWSKLLIGYAVGVGYVVLILTGSRGGYLSAGASLAVFGLLSLLALRRSSARLFWTIGGVGVITAAVVAAAMVFYVQKSDFLTGRAQNTFEADNIRLDLWQAALDQWKLNPVFGTGTGTYLYYGRYFRTERMQLDPVYVHNDYLHLLAEYGLVGVLGLGAFLLVHLGRGWQSFRRLGPKRVAVSPRLTSNALALNIGALAAVTSYLVHSVVDFNLHIPGNLLLLAFVFGLLANDGVNRESAANRVAPRGQLLWRLLLPALGILLIVQCVRLLPGEYFAERSRGSLRDQQPVRAIQLAREGLKYDPENPDLHFYLGLARLTIGERMEDPRAAASFYQQAIPDFQRARAIAPQELPYALELAIALDFVRRFEEAEAVLSEALRLDPRSESVRQAYEAHLKAWRTPPAAAPAPEATGQPVEGEEFPTEEGAPKKQAEG
ncbi:hypothetical protein BH20VER2_BH20VER2_09590 [soil metagenome]|nr:O-antigen ligase family protein [Chthoniobacterales bacterium]